MPKEKKSRKARTNIEDKGVSSRKENLKEEKQKEKDMITDSYKPYTVPFMTGFLENFFCNCVAIRSFHPYVIAFAKPTN